MICNRDDCSRFNCLTLLRVLPQDSKNTLQGRPHGIANFVPIKFQRVRRWWFQHFSESLYNKYIAAWMCARGLTFGLIYVILEWDACTVLQFSSSFFQNRIATDSEAESTTSSMDVLVSLTSSKSENNFSFLRLVAFPTPAKVKILSHLVKTCTASSLGITLICCLMTSSIQHHYLSQPCMGGMKMKTEASHGQRFSQERLPLARKPNLISIPTACLQQLVFQAPLCPSTLSCDNMEIRWIARIIVTIHYIDPLEFFFRRSWQFPAVYLAWACRRARSLLTIISN